MSFFIFKLINNLFLNILFKTKNYTYTMIQLNIYIIRFYD